MFKLGDARTLYGMAFILNEKAKQFCEHGNCTRLFLVCWIENGVPLKKDDWHWAADTKAVQVDWRRWARQEYPWANLLVEIVPTSGHPRTCIRKVTQL